MNTPLIVLTVGTDSHPYDRAVRWIDAWAAANPDARVVAQWGTSTRARHAEGDALLPRPELEALLREADAVVSHGGPATLHQIRQVGLLPLCVPRDPTLGEHVDDHQQRFARHQAARGRIRHLEDEASLHAALDEVVREPSVLRIDPSSDASVAAASVARFAAFVDALLLGDGDRIAEVHETAVATLHREDTP